ncbi:MAG: 30S ribosome-binding factor RbfA [Planctomycetota bacterium]|jgi:ribosome-binding factor A
MAKRADRVAERIKQDLAKAIPLMKNPDIGFVTVTNVKLSDDLQIARVYVSILPIKGHEDPSLCLEAIRHSAGYLQSQIGKSIRTKVIPELKFYIDKSIETSARISSLIKEARATDADHKEDSGIEEEEE